MAAAVIVRALQKFPTFRDGKGVLRYRKPGGKTPAVTRSDAQFKRNRAKKQATKALDRAVNNAQKELSKLSGNSSKLQAQAKAANKKKMSNLTKTRAPKTKTTKKAKLDDAIQQGKQPKTAAAKARRKKTTANGLSKSDERKILKAQNEIDDLIVERRDAERAFARTRSETQDIKDEAAKAVDAVKAEISKRRRLIKRIRAGL